MRVLLLPLLLLVCPLVLMAQAGTLTGKVTNRQTAEALPGATVQLKGSSAMVITDNEGHYTLSPVPAGSITLLVSYAGYEKAALPVTIGEETTTVNVALSLLHQTGNEVVVSASRRPQKITSAPAAISVIDTKDLEQFAGSNTGELMAYVQGVEFVRSGVDQTLFNARGFNNAFNSKVLQIIDGRNSMNTGSSVSTDSRTPRALSTVRPRMNATSAGNFAPAMPGGRKENSASPAAAMEIVMVRT